MRLIDADALDWEHIEEEYYNTIDTVRACKCLVLNAPTIDAVPWDDYMNLHNHFVDWEPIKHGRWIDTDRDDPCYYYCSECHRQVDIQENYCPNCGAMMDKEADNED